MAKGKLCISNNWSRLDAKCDTKQELVHIYRSWPSYEEVLKRLNKSTENQTSSIIDDPFANKTKPK